MMLRSRTIRIAGGGIAGLSLGIALRRRGVPVVISEALQYPRHRVCGEFLSGRGQRVLAELGVLDALRESGITEAVSTAFFCGRSISRPVRLPRAAWCVSRHTLDAVLAREFMASGGELHVGERVPLAASGEGLVRAAGRRQAQGTDAKRWIGLKVHARNVLLTADLEMHLGRDGYVGLCRLPGEEVNVCGLFRRDTAGAKLKEPLELLRGEGGSSLHLRVRGAEFIEKSFCAVSALNPWPRLRTFPGEFCIGDALTMIPPITGNGMSMALESAALAVEPLVEYSAGRLGWAEAIAAGRSACRRAFAERLRWASVLQAALFSSLLRPVIPALIRSPRVIRELFGRTRLTGTLQAAH